MLAFETAKVTIPVSSVKMAKVTISEVAVEMAYVTILEVAVAMQKTERRLLKWRKWPYLALLLKITIVTKPHPTSFYVHTDNVLDRVPFCPLQFSSNFFAFGSPSGSQEDGSQHKTGYPVKVL